MLGFGLLNVYCRFLWFKPSFGEKYLRWIQASEVWAMRIKGSLQRGPKYPKKGKNPRPKAKHRRTPKRSEATKPGHHHSDHHGQTVVYTTARGGSHGLTVVSPTAVVGRFPPIVRFPLRVPLRLLTVLLRFLPLYCNVSGHSDEPNSLQSNYLLHSHSFRLVLGRERGSGEELRGFHTGLRSKDGNAFLDELFFPFSFLFSI